MTERVDPFANLGRPPTFAPRPRKEKAVSNDAIERIAEDHNFPSRSARKEPTAPKRKPRTYRTGRNQNFGLKARAETIERYHKMADDRGVTRARLLELALDALEGAGGSDELNSRPAPDSR
jgi:hypothetical protein